MDVFLPQGFAPGRGRVWTDVPRRSAHLRVKVGDESYPVLRRWASGFAMAADQGPAVAGIVDLYDGPQHLYQCLVIRHETRDAEHVFTVKRADAVHYAAVSGMEGAAAD